MFFEQNLEEEDLKDNLTESPPAEKFEEESIDEQERVNLTESSQSNTSQNDALIGNQQDSRKSNEINQNTEFNLLGKIVREFSKADDNLFSKQTQFKKQKNNSDFADMVKNTDSPTRIEDNVQKKHYTKTNLYIQTQLDGENDQKPSREKTQNTLQNQQNNVNMDLFKMSTQQNPIKSDYNPFLKKQELSSDQNQSLNQGQFMFSNNQTLNSYQNPIINQQNPLINNQNPLLNGSNLFNNQAKDSTQLNQGNTSDIFSKKNDYKEQFKINDNKQQSNSAFGSNSLFSSLNDRISCQNTSQIQPNKSWLNNQSVIDIPKKIYDLPSLTRLQKQEDIINKQLKEFEQEKVSQKQDEPQASIDLTDQDTEKIKEIKNNYDSEIQILQKELQILQKEVQYLKMISTQKIQEKF